MSEKPQFPLLYLFKHHCLELGAGIALTAIMAALEGVAAMLVPYLVTSLFPAKVRLTGVAMCYNLSFTIFSGLAPIVVTSLIGLGYRSFQVTTGFVLVLIIISSGGVWLTKLVPNFRT